MAIINLELLKGLFGKPASLPARDVYPAALKGELSKNQIEQLRGLGLAQDSLMGLMTSLTMVNFERTALYREMERSLLHPMIGAGMELYADVVTAYDRVQNATVWITSDIPEYQRELEALFDRINVEERIFDWTWNTGAYGDLMVELFGELGVGITHIDDTLYPASVSRLDYNGRLTGFIETPLGIQSAETKKLRPPWDFVHFRLLGALKRRYTLGNPNYTEFRASDLVGHDAQRITTKYGSSLLLSALPIYKRLRMAEDSLLLARLSKGVMRYIYKLKVDKGLQPDAVQSLIQQYERLLKRSGAINVDDNSPFFDEKYYEGIVNEDVLIPVWGDDDFTVEKLGGEVDIHGIKDIDELKRQLSIALRVPLALLGDTGDLPSTLGQSALERLDIRFARSARRLQRAVLVGLTRLCQIHLAWMGYNPSEKLFKVNMADTSTAEEEEIKDALDKGVDVVDKLYELLSKAAMANGEVLDGREFLDYANQKLLKLNDIDLKKMFKKAPPMLPPATEGSAGVGPSAAEMGGPPPGMEDLITDEGAPPEEPVGIGAGQGASVQPEVITPEFMIKGSDLRALTPFTREVWDQLYEGVLIELTPRTPEPIKER